MKKILWLQTGGTVNCVNTYDGLTPVSNAGLSVVTDGVAYVSESVFSADSTDITPRHWRILAEKIFEAREIYDGFVITHGTDTMQYSASALALMLENFGKPIIFTGAMLPPSDKDSDAASNLANAFEAARDTERGVYVAFAGKIINALSCVKINSKNKDAFIDAGRALPEPRDISAPPALKNKICEKVFYLKITPAINSDAADFILEKGYKGVVCEGYGLGGIERGFLEKLGELVKKGVKVVVVSQCLYGGADLSVYAAHKRASGLGIEAWDMTGSAALVRLMLELAESYPDALDVKQS